MYHAIVILTHRNLLISHDYEPCSSIKTFTTPVLMGMHVATVKLLVRFSSDVGLAEQPPSFFLSCWTGFPCTLYVLVDDSSTKDTLDYTPGEVGFSFVWGARCWILDLIVMAKGPASGRSKAGGRRKSTDSH